MEYPEHSAPTTPNGSLPQTKTQTQTHSHSQSQSQTQPHSHFAEYAQRRSLGLARAQGSRSANPYSVEEDFSGYHLPPISAHVEYATPTGQSQTPGIHSHSAFGFDNPYAHAAASRGGGEGIRLSP